MSADASDLSLVRRVQRGDKGAFDALVLKYQHKLVKLVVTANPHSLPIFRINNVVSNMPEFAQAFGCKAGQKMVRANACRVW